MALTLLSLSTASLALAHTPVTTKYRFYSDVRPVLEKHCVRCHAPGGPTPMSLLSYDETRPWAESMKEQVLARNMPPVFLEHGSAEVANGAPLTGRELDVLVDWASGGAPEGAPPPGAKAPVAGAGSNSRASAGDGARPFPVRPRPAGRWQTFVLDAVTLAADEEERREVQLVPVTGDPGSYLTGWTIDGDDLRWLRSAVVWVDGGGNGRPGAAPPDTNVFIGSWIHREDPFLFPEGTALELSPGVSLKVELHYKRTWLQRSRVLTTRTRLELRLTDTPPRRKVISVRVPPPASGDRPLPADAGALAFFPLPGGTGQLLLETRDATASGSRVLLDLYRVSDEWPVTYRFTPPAPGVGRLVWTPVGAGPGERAAGHLLYVAR